MTSSFRKALFKSALRKGQGPLPFEQKIYYGNILLNGISQSTVKVFQWNPLKVSALKGSTKGLMAGAYRRAT